MKKMRLPHPSILEETSSMEKQSSKQQLKRLGLQYESPNWAPTAQVATQKSFPAVVQRQRGTSKISKVAANKTGLPSQLKQGAENLGKVDLSDVEVHYNSRKPAQLQALAYAQGNQIHIAPGQEKHLPHEAWHVVQQKKQQVKPTLQLKTGVRINNDTALEKEADVMGARALQMGRSSSTLIEQQPRTPSSKQPQETAQRAVVQRKIIQVFYSHLVDNKTKTFEIDDATTGAQIWAKIRGYFPEAAQAKITTNSFQLIIGTKAILDDDSPIILKSEANIQLRPVGGAKQKMAERKDEAPFSKWNGEMLACLEGANITLFNAPNGDARKIIPQQRHAEILQALTSGSSATFTFIDMAFAGEDRAHLVHSLLTDYNWTFEQGGAIMKATSGKVTIYYLSADLSGAEIKTLQTTNKARMFSDE